MAGSCDRGRWVRGQRNGRSRGQQNSEIRDSETGEATGQRISGRHCRPDRSVACRRSVAVDGHARRARYCSASTAFLNAQRAQRSLCGPRPGLYRLPPATPADRSVALGRPARDRALHRAAQRGLAARVLRYHARRSRPTNVPGVRGRLLRRLLRDARYRTELARGGHEPGAIVLQRGFPSPSASAGPGALRVDPTRPGPPGGTVSCCSDDDDRSPAWTRAPLPEC